MYHTLVLPCGRSRLYSDVEECLPLDQKVPALILSWGMEIFLKVHDTFMQLS